MRIRRITGLLILVLMVAFIVPCFAADDNEYNDFIRTVVDGKMVKVPISPFFTQDSDSDKINTIFKNNVTTGTFTGANTAGIVLKGYYQSGVGIAANSEVNGATTILLNDATLTGGAKSAIHSFHVHADTSTTPDFGLRLFGTVTDDLIQFASGGAADGIDMTLSTITGNDIVLNATSTESVIKKVVDGTGTDVTAGTIIKSYMNDADVVITGGTAEFVGLAVYGKQLAAMAGGAKSSLISAHQHSDSTTDFDRGLSLFGDVTSALYVSGANTNLLETPDTVSAGFSTGSLKDSGDSDIACDAYLTVAIAGTTYYLPLYNTLN